MPRKRLPVIGSCRNCGTPLRSHLTGQKNKTGLCQDCARRRRRRPPNRCADCGKEIQRASKRCQKCYTANMAERNRMHPAALAEARAAKVGWRGGRVSRAEMDARELLDSLGIEWAAQVPMASFVMDLVCLKERMVVDVRSRYYHNLPGAVDRSERREAAAKARGYGFVVLWEDRRHMWWKVLRDYWES